MNKYTCICLRDNVKCYQMTKIITDEELIEQKIFWNVSSFSQLLQRWNQQPESVITKLKWFYYE